MLYICTQKSNRKLFLLKPFLVFRYSIGFLGFKSIKKEQLKGEKRRIMNTHNDKGYLVSDQNGKVRRGTRKKRLYCTRGHERMEQGRPKKAMSAPKVEARAKCIVWMEQNVKKKKDRDVKLEQDSQSKCITPRHPNVERRPIHNITMMVMMIYSQQLTLLDYTYLQSDQLHNIPYTKNLNRAIEFNKVH